MKRVVQRVRRRARWRPTRSTTSGGRRVRARARSAPRSTTTRCARLKVEIIAGGANNQLAEDRHGDLLEQRGILYAPDYVINGGGVINVYGELHRWPHERAKKKAGEIYETLLRIFEIAKRERIPTYRAADRLAEERIAAVGSLDRMWMGENGRR